MRAVVIKEFHQLRRDRRTMAMLVMIPLALLLVFGFAASFDVKSLRVAVYGPAAQTAAQRLPDRFDVVTIDPAGGAAQAEELLRRADATVAIVTGSSPSIYVDGADLFGARAALAAISTQPGLPAPTVLFNPTLETRVIMIPAIIGMILVFVGMVATSLGVVRERQAGTFETLLVMPFRARDIFIGKLAPYFAVAILDMVVVVIAGLLVFNVPFNGSVLTFGLGAILFLFVTTGLGVLISLVSQTQGQAIQLAFMTLLPQVLLSGMVFPLDAIPVGVRWISYLLPLTYFTQISRGVMIRGTPIDALLVPFAALTVMAVVVFGVSVLRFRRELAPSPGRRHGPAPEGNAA